MCKTAFWGAYESISAVTIGFPSSFSPLVAVVFTHKDEDIVDTILHFAGEYRVGHIVIGRPGPLSWRNRLLGRKTVVERLILKARGLTVVVVDVKTEPKPLGTGKQRRPPDFEEDAEPNRA